MEEFFEYNFSAGIWQKYYQILCLSASEYQFGFFIYFFFHVQTCVNIVNCKCDKHNIISVLAIRICVKDFIHKRFAHSWQTNHSKRISRNQCSAAFFFFITSKNKKNNPRIFYCIFNTTIVKDKCYDHFDEWNLKLIIIKIAQFRTPMPKKWKKTKKSN